MPEQLVEYHKNTKTKAWAEYCDSERPLTEAISQLENGGAKRAGA